MRAILIILDSLGIGEAPDASEYGDGGAATLQNTAEAVGGLSVPTLAGMGLGNIPPLTGLAAPLDRLLGAPPAPNPTASYGVMRPASEGKDTITGHWEIAGLELRPGFRVFPCEYPSFPEDIILAFERETGRGVIGNKAASGTEIIEELGAEHLSTGSWIVYTSADSVFQIAAHKDAVPLEELYRGCETARMLCNPYNVGRVIARPFDGKPGSFKRTGERRDYAFRPEEKTVLERLTDAGIPVWAVGKIEDIYAHRGITESSHTGNTADSQEEVLRLTHEKRDGLIIANFIDFDMMYGHRRDPAGYARALSQADEWLQGYLGILESDDLLILTADHGNDPVFKGTDHTREFVPLLAYRRGAAARPLGNRKGFFDVAQTLADFFSIDPMARGVSFMTENGKTRATQEDFGQA